MGGKKKQNEHRIAYGTSNGIREQVIVTEASDQSLDVLPSKPSKFGDKNEGGLLSRIFKKKKSRTLSKHDLSRSENEVKKKIQIANEKEASRQKALEVTASAEVVPDGPLLKKLCNSIDCGLEEPLPTRPKEDFDKSIIEMRASLADGRKIYTDDLSAAAADRFSLQLSSAADILKAVGKADEGIECLLESIQLCRRHPTLKENLALYLNDLGLLYCSVGYFREAKKSLFEAHAIMRDINGDIHPDVAACGGNLGIAYSGCKENSFSSDVMANSIRAMESIYGKDHEFTLQQRALLGTSLITAGDSGEAKKELRSVIAKLKQLPNYSEGHPFLAFLQGEFQRALSVSS